MIVSACPQVGRMIDGACPQVGRGQYLLMSPLRLVCEPLAKWSGNRAFKENPKRSGSAIRSRFGQPVREQLGRTLNQADLLPDIQLAPHQRHRFAQAHAGLEAR